MIFFNGKGEGSGEISAKKGNRARGMESSPTFFVRLDQGRWLSPWGDGLSSWYINSRMVPFHQICPGVSLFVSRLPIHRFAGSTMQMLFLFFYLFLPRFPLPAAVFSSYLMARLSWERRNRGFASHTIPPKEKIPPAEAVLHGRRETTFSAARQIHRGRNSGVTRTPFCLYPTGYRRWDICSMRSCPGGCLWETSLGRGLMNKKSTTIAKPSRKCRVVKSDV